MSSALSPMNRSPLLTEQEVADLFRVTTRTVRRWARAGQLAPVRIGGTTRYRPDELDAFLRSNNDESPATNGALEKERDDGAHRSD